MKGTLSPGTCRAVLWDILSVTSTDCPIPSPHMGSVFLEPPFGVCTHRALERGGPGMFEQRGKQGLRLRRAAA